MVKEKHRALASALTEDGVFLEAAILENHGASTAVVVPSPGALDAVRTGRPGDHFRVIVMQRADGLVDRVIARLRRLPKTSAGTVDIERLTDELTNTCANSPPSNDIPCDLKALGTSAIGVWQILQSRTHLPLQPGLSPALDLGIDSIDWVELLIEIEQTCGRRLSEDDVADIRTVDDLVRRAVAAPQIVAPEDCTGDGTPPLLRISADEARWLTPRNWAMRQAGKFLCLLNKLLVRSYFGLTVHGLHRLPKNGPYVIAYNHVSDLDQCIVSAALPYRLLSQTSWAGDRGRLFSLPIARLFCRICGVFPVDDHVARSSIASACASLADGRIQMWFPEGWRSPDGRLQPFARGLGAILHHRPVPVVPAVIGGAFEAMPRDRRYPRPLRLTITFGEPLHPEQLKSGNTGDPYADLMTGLAHAIARLAGHSDQTDGQGAD